MDFSKYEKRQKWKFLLFVSAIIIGVGSLTYTNNLVKDLSVEEREKVKLWAEATRILISSSPGAHDDLSLPLMVIENNNSVPIILTDSASNIIRHRNLDSVKVGKPGYLKKVLNHMKVANEPIEIDFGEGNKNFIFFMDSILLTRLFYFPYIQLLIIVLFIFVSYFAFSTSRRAEQNSVWVGLSKETAHQLGTPTSSLNAWIELLKGGANPSSIVVELEKDAKRLEKITERFSKIGSKPLLTQTDLIKVLEGSINYLKTRCSEKIKFKLKHAENEVIVPINESLFEWVIENVCKNAMDAMNGSGEITLKTEDHSNNIFLDISDTGRGIPKSLFKTIFRPGYTTKTRGWGLGLSLSKRIIETYHSGRIYVLSSEINSGTTIRIELKKYIS